VPPFQDLPPPAERLLDRALTMYPKVARGVLPADRFAEMTETIDALLATPKPVTRGINYCPLSLVAATEERRLADRLLSIFMRSVGYAIAQKILGPHPVFLLHHCIVRRRDIRDPADASPWHLDADFMGATGEMLNIWIPLVDVGSDHPGLSFLTDKDAVRRVWRAWCRWVDDPTSRTRPDMPFPPVSDPEWLAATAGIDPDHRAVTPPLSAGDAIIFNQCVPHRTQATAGAAAPRYSIELRLAGRDDVPDYYRTRNVIVARPERVEGGVAVQYLNSTDL